jgi:hypothetical protein
MVYFELVNLYFHQVLDANALAAGTTDVNEDPVALYLGYYDWSLSQRLQALDLWIVRILFRHFYKWLMSYVTLIFYNYSLNVYNTLIKL